MNKMLFRTAGVGLVALALLLAACAPAAGRATVQFEGQAEDIIGAIAEIGITLQPGSAYNFYSINSIGERFITLQATTTGGVSFFLGGSTTTLNFSAIQNGDVVTLAASGSGAGSDDSIEQITEQLTVRFPRVR